MADESFDETGDPGLSLSEPVTAPEAIALLREGVVIHASVLRSVLSLCMRLASSTEELVRISQRMTRGFDDTLDALSARSGDYMVRVRRAYGRSFLLSDAGPVSLNAGSDGIPESDWNAWVSSVLTSADFEDSDVPQRVPVDSPGVLSPVSDCDAISLEGTSSSSDSVALEDRQPVSLGVPVNDEGGDRMSCAEPSSSDPSGSAVPFERALWLGDQNVEPDPDAVPSPPIDHVDPPLFSPSDGCGLEVPLLVDAVEANICSEVLTDQLCDDQLASEVSVGVTAPSLQSDRAVLVPEPSVSVASVPGKSGWISGYDHLFRPRSAVRPPGA